MSSEELVVEDILARDHKEVFLWCSLEPAGKSGYLYCSRGPGLAVKDPSGSHGKAETWERLVRAVGLEVTRMLRLRVSHLLAVDCPVCGFALEGHGPDEGAAGGADVLASCTNADCQTNAPR